MSRKHLASNRSTASTQDGGDYSQASPMFSDFARKFLDDGAGRWRASTFAINEDHLEQDLIPIFGRRGVRSIRRQDVIDWMNGPFGSNRGLSVISQIMSHAELLEIRPTGTNPCKGIPRIKSTFSAICPTSTTYQEMDRFLSHEMDDKECAALFRFVALTGARHGEAFHLQWKSIQGNHATLPRSKWQPKTIWFSTATRKLLNGKRRRDNCPFVFGGRNRFEFQVRVATQWRELREYLNLEFFRLHDLRHGFASTGINSGIELEAISVLLGHSNLRTTLGYVHLDQTMLRATAERIVGAMTARLGLTD